MTNALLITQCLQNDFVKPLGPHDPLPNLLHIGHSESKRLLGVNSAEGPIAKIMAWAYQLPDDELDLIHIRDWHDRDDSAQRPHLEQFGEHCLQNTPGAQFVFSHDDAKSVEIINSITLNDFVDTNLEQVLDKYKGESLKVGLIGVWTEAKIMFLAYELSTRYPEFSICICSALAASNSRSQHFIALEQLEKLLGVTVLSSIGDFREFLTGDNEAIPLSQPNNQFPVLRKPDSLSLSSVDEDLIRYLYRDCKSVDLTVLDGGFSGNIVVGTESTDQFDHRQVPHVVKIGASAEVGQERTSFERIEAVLGNNAPSITDFADLQGRGAIKYRYASMRGSFTTTLQKHFMEGASIEEIESILNTIFREQLGRFYSAAKLEKADLLNYYEFDSKWAGSVRSKVENLLGCTADKPLLAFDDGTTFPNICDFYESTLQNIGESKTSTHHFSYIHGDLNGANIIIDQQANVWLIDFFHTHYGHVLKDLIKLENDVLYIFTTIEGEAELQEAMSLSRVLLAIDDLRADLPDAKSFCLSNKKLARAYQTIRILRAIGAELVGSDRDPLQFFIGQMRYAVHTLSFDESNPWQKKWALYTAALCSEEITRRFLDRRPLTVDWLPASLTDKGKLGLTILPGRKDKGRDLSTDIAALREQSVTHILCLLTEDEFHAYGVPGLIEEYRTAGFRVLHSPIFDQKAPSTKEADSIIEWLEDAISQGAQVATHCVGGLGRSGTIAACYLMRQGLSSDDGIQAVRNARSIRAIETLEQETFVHQFS